MATAVTNIGKECMRKKSFEKLWERDRLVQGVRQRYRQNASKEQGSRRGVGWLHMQRSRREREPGGVRDDATLAAAKRRSVAQKTGSLV
eukprot:4948340-Pleurochrysis_carterae.AAC.1